MGVDAPRVNVETLYLDTQYDNDGAYVCGIYG
jgi:hypothetical protein